MNGLVIETLWNGEFSPLLNHRIQGNTILEHTIANMLQVSQAHQVVVSCPERYRRQIENAVYKLYPGQKKVGVRFQDTVSQLDGCFRIAQESGWDFLTRVCANQPLLPAWVVNDNLKSFRLSANGHQKCQSGGLLVETVSYSGLASLYSDLDQDERDGFDRGELGETGYPAIESFGADLRWTDIGQHQQFEHLITGAAEFDLEDMLKELSGGIEQKDFEK